MHVVVTGIGLVTPLGASREATWQRLIEGETGIRAERGALIARVRGVSANGAHSRAGDFAVVAAEEALAQSGLDIASHDIGCAIGQSKPLFTDDGAADAQLLLASFTGWSLEAVVKTHFELNGPSANVAAACATGVAAIETAASWIRSGACTAALAGAAESSLTDFYRAGFSQMGVLAEGTNPSSVRPFDRARAGFAMGEGAAVLVLESEDACRARGGKPIARLGRASLQQSSVDPIRFDDDGRDVARLITAVCDGKPAPSYVNAHGTGTALNDAAEARGLARAFSAGANVWVGSTKAATGHLLGAAGAVEAAFAALAIERGVMPPSLNVSEPDALCTFPLVSNAARRGDVVSAMSLSYGFGGQMGAVLFERP